jgi:hypothetical protein
MSSGPKQRCLRRSWQRQAWSSRSRQRPESERSHWKGPDAVPSGTGSDQDTSAWDAVASTYAEIGGSTGTASSRFARFVSEAVGDPTDLDTLDVDRGHGWLAGRLSALGANAKEFEGGGEPLRVAREWYPQVKFHQAT